MIKHLGEALVPFESDGFDRLPSQPLVNEAVTVRCRMDNTDEVPTLTLQTQAGESTVAATTVDGHFYAFDLGSFDAPQTVRYQIAAQSEATPWFAFDVAVEETITAAAKVAGIKYGIAISLTEDVTLTLQGGNTLRMTLAQQPMRQDATGDAELALPDGFTLVVGKDAIWELNRLSEQVCKCTGYTLRRNAERRVTHVTAQLIFTAKHIFGTGERFDTVDQKNRGSNGRVVEKFTHQKEQTYLPIPFFMTEQRYGWWRQSDIPAEMNFAAQASIAQQTEGETLTKDVLYFGQPMDVLTQFGKATGQPVLPPEWAFGVWISGNGWKTDADVDAELAAMKKHDYPASVIVLEQWSDERTFYLWHETNWADPAAMVQRVRDAGLHMVLWQIPVIKHEWDKNPGAALLADTKEALEKNYIIRREDGEPYHITERWFHHSYLPDFTNPEAVAWWFEKRKPLLDMGVEGFKTDGGEFLFDSETRLHDGTSGLAAHNLYPAQYVGAYQDFLQNSGINGVTFSRAGYTGVQTQPIHWAGDQMSEWCELQSQLAAGISAGLSGVLYWSFDIGGFAGPIPSAELYLRATAFGCFCPVMQWHAEPRGGQFSGGLGEGYNNDRSPWNLAEKLEDERVLTIGCEFARLREKLRPYLWTEAKHCASTGRPMMAHLCLDYPDDETAWTVQDQYMLGRDLLVAPIMQQGATTRTVYLPKGSWVDYFTKETVQGPCKLEVSCPVDRIPVYRKEETPCKL